MNNKIELNLRNWRDDVRKKKTKSYANFNAIVFSSLLIIMILIALFQEQEISKQKTINGYLKSEMKYIDQDVDSIAKLEKTMNQIVERMEIINSLQSNRSDLVYMLDEIALITPKEIKLSLLKRESGMIKIEGVAISQLNISQYLKNLSESESFQAPRLDRVVADNKVDGFERSKFFITAQEKKKSSLISGGSESE